MGGRKPLKRKGGSASNLAHKLARQRSAPPSPSPPPNSSDSETIESLSDSSTMTSCTSDKDPTLTAVTKLASPSVPKNILTSAPKNNLTSVPKNNLTSVPKTTTSQTSPATKPPTKPTNSRPPPIILNSSSWRKIAPVIYALPNLSPNSMTAKSSANNKVSIQTSDSAQFRLIQSTLLSNGTEFHTFSLPEERSVKVVLKGIPTDIPVDEIKRELETLGFSTSFIRRFGTPEKPMPLCLVHITADQKSKDIFLLHNLFYISISVEPLKSSGPSQCFSCQRFGHGSRNCGHPPRCVKCAGNHAAKDCSKTREQSPTCCNCGGPHTANFRGCSHFLEQKQLPPPTSVPIIQIPQTQPPPKSSPPPPAPKPTSTISYASATSGSALTPRVSPAPQLDLTLILSLLTNLLTAISTNQDPQTLIQSTIKTFLTILTPRND